MASSSPESTSMALFCDFENVALGVRDAQHDKFDIKRVLERLLLKGSIVVKKAYCDWDRYKHFKATMHEANFELIEIPHVRQSGKNSADIRLVVDALDLCYTKSHVDTFVIISGDSDFSPLVSKLRENAKQVIGVGVKQSTSDLLIANCDEFIFYDDLVREDQRAAARRAAQQPPANRRPADGESRRHNSKEDPDARRVKALDLAVETLEALGFERGDGGKIRTSVLKDAIKRRKPDFNETYFGFRSFGGLLEEAQTRGLLELVRDEKGNAYVQRAVPGSQRHEPRLPEPASAPARAPAPAPGVMSAVTMDEPCAPALAERDPREAVDDDVAPPARSARPPRGTARTSRKATADEPGQAGTTTAPTPAPGLNTEAALEPAPRAAEPEEAAPPARKAAGRPRSKAAGTTASASRRPRKKAVDNGAE
ncbi:MAG: NYN domain-containing protein [Pseudomonadota bacterium]